MHDPWDDVARLPGWRVDWVHLHPRRGLCRWAERLILLDRHLGRVSERCVLTHEAVHAARGPFPAWARDVEEEQVQRESARRLITLDALLDTLAWTLDPHEAAECLDVDVPTLMARMRHLHPSERAALRRRLGDQN